MRLGWLFTICCWEPKNNKTYIAPPNVNLNNENNIEMPATAQIQPPVYEQQPSVYQQPLVYEQQQPPVYQQQPPVYDQQPPSYIVHTDEKTETI